MKKIMQYTKYHFAMFSNSRKINPSDNLRYKVKNIYTNTRVKNLEDAEDLREKNSEEANKNNEERIRKLESTIAAMQTNEANPKEIIPEEPSIVLNKPLSMAEEIKRALKEVNSSLNNEDIPKPAKVASKPAIVASKPKSATPSPFINTSAKDIMNEVKCKVGIYPIERTSITKYHWVTDDVIHDSNDKVFKSAVYNPARNEAAKAFFIDMGIAEEDIEFDHVKMCHNPEKRILWVCGNELFISKVFSKAAEVQRRDISTIMYTPHEAFARKSGIDKILKNIRAENKDLRTIIKPGEEDFVVKIKRTTRHEHDRYEEVAIERLDPKNELPKFKLKHKADTNEAKAYIQEAMDKLQKPEEGWTTVTKKRTLSTPEKSSSKKVRNTSPKINNYIIAEVIERICGVVNEIDSDDDNNINSSEDDKPEKGTPASEENNQAVST